MGGENIAISPVNFITVGLMALVFILIADWLVKKFMNKNLVGAE